MLKFAVVFGVVFVAALVIVGALGLLWQLWLSCTRMDKSGYEDSTSDYGGLGE